MNDHLTDDFFIPVSEGLRDHLKNMKGSVSIVYMYLLLSATRFGENAGKAYMSMRDVAADLTLSVGMVHKACKQLAPKYITYKPSRNQNGVTEFMITKYKTMDSFTILDKSAGKKKKNTAVQQSEQQEPTDIAVQPSEQPVHPSEHRVHSGEHRVHSSEQPVQPSEQRVNSGAQKSLKNSNLQAPKEVEEGKSTEEVEEGKNDDAQTVSQRKNGQIPYDRILDLWKKHCPMMSQPRAMTDKRKKKIKLRWDLAKRLEPDREPIDFIEAIFKTVSATPFLRGDNDRRWQADLDWIFKNEENFLKIVEGKYEGKSHAKERKSLMNRDMSHIFGKDNK